MQQPTGPALFQLLKVADPARGAHEGTWESELQQPHTPNKIWCPDMTRDTTRGYAIFATLVILLILYMGGSTTHIFCCSSNAINSCGSFTCKNGYFFLSFIFRLLIITIESRALAHDISALTTAARRALRKPRVSCCHAQNSSGVNSTTSTRI